MTFRKKPKLPKQICILADSNNKRGYVNGIYPDVDTCRPSYVGVEKFVGVYELKEIIAVGNLQTTKKIEP